MKTDFSSLVESRREWRVLHRNQDSDGADEVFRKAGAGIPLPAEALKTAPEFRTKLNDLGREWERAISAAAVAEGFAVHEAELSLAITGVEAFHAWVEARLEESQSPRGAPLFFESAGSHPIGDGVWNSRFFFVLRSEIDPDTLGWAEAPGIRGAPVFRRIA